MGLRWKIARLPNVFTILHFFFIYQIFKSLFLDFLNFMIYIWGKTMKALVIASILLLGSLTLSAKEGGENFILGITDIETSNSEIATALTLKLKQHTKESFVTISYVSELLNNHTLQEPTKLQTQQMQNIYVAFNYSY